MQQELLQLEEHSNPRHLPKMIYDGREVIVNSKRMLNLPSNDYLGLASDRVLHGGFLRTFTPDTLLPSSSSSRLLTGNLTVHEELGARLSHLSGTEGALVFSSGYYANAGILPTVSDAHTLILADKLVRASLIDSIHLSAAKYIRYRHNDLTQPERLLEEHHTTHHRVIIVTESILSMDGDQAGLQKLTELKRKYDNVLLYVDEAHAFGIRDGQGLGCVKKFYCIHDTDLLVDTFGKMAVSVGAYIVCRKVIREYLTNRIRTLIFITGLLPMNIAWALFIVRRPADVQERRKHLVYISWTFREVLQVRGYTRPNVGHIVPMIIGPSAGTVPQAEALQRHGLYALSVRPPTVPEGTSRICFSLATEIRKEEIEELSNNISAYTD